jgi:hypothetical protein
MIDKNTFDKGLTYNQYFELTEQLVNDGRTTGSDQSEAMVEYTKLNLHRMNRLNKTISISEELAQKLSNMTCPVRWALLTEAWCGDAAQNVPILAKMAELAPSIELRLLLRDEHLDIMDSFLTNGGRAIPKLIIMDADMNVIGTWGPRPKEVQDMVMENKRTGGMPYSEFAKVVQKWYAQDKGTFLQKEMQEVLKVAGCFGH